MKPIVVINAGHGGSDNGARAINGEYEKDINLEVVKHFKKLAEPYADKIDFQYPRLEDKTISLRDRVDFANLKQANLYISVHHNASGSSADGAETIHSIFGGEGQKVAEIIMKEFEELGQNKRRVFAKKSNVNANKNYFYEIRYTGMPAIITEFAFIDSKDFYDIDSLEERIEEARAILKSVLKYYDIEQIIESQSDVPRWKLTGILELCEDGILNDKDGWIKKIDQPMPVWATTLLLNQIYQKLK